MTKEDIDNIIGMIQRDETIYLFDRKDRNDRKLYSKLSDIENKLKCTYDLKSIESKRLLKEYFKILFQVLKNKIPEDYKDYFYMEMAKSEYDFYIITFIENDDDKIKYLELLPNDECRVEIIKGMEDEKILSFLPQYDEKYKILLISGIKNQEKREKAFELLEGEYKEALKRMYSKNEEVLECIDIRILEPRYLQTLGEEKINLISCYWYEQRQILELTEKEYTIFTKCLECYILQESENEDWPAFVEVLLENIRKGQYTELINNIDDIDAIDAIDILKLSRILQLTNYFNIKTIDDIKNYEEIKKKSAMK